MSATESLGSAQATGLFDLPEELLIQITETLSGIDVKSLRLVNKRMSDCSPLRMRRVFLSPSYRNIEVFLAVARHPELSRQVKEIVWDDARFENYSLEAEGAEEENGSDYSEDEDYRADERPKSMQHFKKKCKENLDWFTSKSASSLVRARTGSWPESEDELMTMDENFALYTHYYEEQQEIIANGLDFQALREGLAAFSSLERMVITSEAHRPAIHVPRYHTPMIRAFPSSFNYPPIWPWRTEDYEKFSDGEWSNIKRHWRGISVVLNEMAQCGRKAMPDLLINVQNQETGVPYQMFETDCAEFADFRKICDVGIRRLDLAISIDQNHGSPGLVSLAENDKLRKVLATATYMEHFALHTSAWSIQQELSWMPANVIGAFRVVPLESWPLLRHLTISKIPVDASEFIEFLKRLPKTLETLDLVDIELFGDHKWEGIFRILRDDLRWRGKRPSITFKRSHASMRTMWIRDAIADFFNGGVNPFYSNRFADGCGVDSLDYEGVFND